MNNRFRRLALILIVATLIVMVCALSACAGNVNEFSRYVEVDRTGLHEGDSLPDISLLNSYLGSVEWEDPDQLIVGGNYDYNYTYTDEYGNKYTGVITINATYCVHTTYEIIKEPTCIENGIQESVCDICGEDSIYESIPALGHDYSVAVTVQGDCQHRSYTYMTCSRCGTAETDENGEIIYTYGDYGDHVWATNEDGSWLILEEDIVTPPTCASAGKGYVRCIYYDICGSKMLVDIQTTDCLYENEVHTDLGCCEYGYTEYTCVYCGSYQMDEDDDTQTYKVYDDYYGSCSYEYGICTECGDIDTLGYDVQYVLTTSSSVAYANLYLYETIGAVEYYNMVLYGEGDIVGLLDNGDAPWCYDYVTYNGKTYSYSQLIRNITVVDGITALGANMFNGCTGLQTVVIPNSVTSIPDYCFANCSQLSSITMPDSVVSIGDYAFSKCNSLVLDISSLPSALQYIGFGAFEQCSAITNLDFRTFTDSATGNLLIGGGAFVGVSSADYVVLTDKIKLYSYTNTVDGVVIYTPIQTFDDVPIFALYDYDELTEIYGDNTYYLGDVDFEQVAIFDDDGTFTIVH